MSQAVPRGRPYKRRNRDVLGPFEQAGEQLLFWWEVLRNIPLTIRQYGKQIGTILAELSLGTGVFIIAVRPNRSMPRAVVIQNAPE